MRNYFLFLCLISPVLLSSCDGLMIGASTPAAVTRYYLPGESLASPKLEVTVSGLDSYGGSPVLFVRPDLENLETKDDNPRIRYGKTYSVLPSGDAYQLFGDNAGEIRASYENMVNELKLKLTSKDCDMVTLLYDGGMKLTANSSVLGVEKGENLMSCFEVVVNQRSEEIHQAFDLPVDYDTMLGACFRLVPTKKYALPRKNVTLDLEIPVRTVMYLSWLNDRISNPEAPLPYRLDTLRCQFVASFPVDDAPVK